MAFTDWRAGCSSGNAASDESSGGNNATATGGVYDATMVHSFAVELEDADFLGMIAAYEESGDKEWITASVSIDGETFDEVGLRLKGNSSLRSVSSDANPTDLPWLIDLDKFVDGQDLDGHSEFVVRSNTTESALNEAVALDLLEEAGLASEHTVAARFSVNGGGQELRLVVQNLDDDWDEENFDTEGILYKAEAGGDYSYRGEDAAEYEDVFDQETRKDEENLKPLIEFLDFVNNSDDETFAAELDEHLDLEAFATYLAFEDLIGNTDDIDGPGAWRAPPPCKTSCFDSAITDEEQLQQRLEDLLGESVVSFEVQRIDLVNDITVVRVRRRVTANARSGRAVAGLNRGAA